MRVVLKCGGVECVRKLQLWRQIWSDTPWYTLGKSLIPVDFAITASVCRVTGHGMRRLVKPVVINWNKHIYSIKGARAHCILFRWDPWEKVLRLCARTAAENFRVRPTLSSTCLFTLKKRTLNVICVAKSSLSLAVFTNMSSLKLVKERWSRLVGCFKICSILDWSWHCVHYEYRRRRQNLSLLS